MSSLDKYYKINKYSNGKMSALVPKEKQPYTCRYDDIVEFTYLGNKGYYCDGSWYSDYDFAWNVRAASILGG